MKIVLIQLFHSQKVKLREFELTAQIFLMDTLVACTDEDRSSSVAVLLTMIFSTGESVPASLHGEHTLSLVINSHTRTHEHTHTHTHMYAHTHTIC